MVISIAAKRAFDKIQHSFIMKTFNKVCKEGTYLNMIKAIYDKSTTNFIINGEKLKDFNLRSGTGKWCPLSPLLFNILLEILTTTDKKKK